MAAAIALITVTGMYGSPHMAKPTVRGLFVTTQNMRIPQSIFKIVPSVIPKE